MAGNLPRHTASLRCPGSVSQSCRSGNIESLAEKQDFNVIHMIVSSPNRVSLEVEEFKSSAITTKPKAVFRKVQSGDEGLVLADHSIQCVSRVYAV